MTDKPTPKGHSVALWGNLVVAHLWAAACWVRPGIAPAIIATVCFLMAGLFVFEDSIKAYFADGDGQPIEKDEQP